MASTSWATEAEKGGNINNGTCELIWLHLSYTINNSLPTRISRRIQGFESVPKTKQILQDISGRIRSGQLVAFMGPSGSGKSTLMECVVNRRVIGRSGNVYIKSSAPGSIKMSFVSQKNHFLSLLTVKEIILFAAKLQLRTKAGDDNVSNSKHQYEQHYLTVSDTVIRSLGLQSCADSKITDCSGGQLKRVAIAQELVGEPKIIVLDEPTSGLDASSSFHVIKMLRRLTEQNIAVLASIHQPSAKVLSLFHKLYILNSNGNCIFESEPLKLNNVLKSYGVTCPKTCSPAESVIDLSDTEELENKHRELYERVVKVAEQTHLLSEVAKQYTFPFWAHLSILVHRNYIITFRDPISFWLRIATTVAAAFFTVSLFGTTVGAHGGCPPKFDSVFEPSQLNDFRAEIVVEVKTVYSNVGNIFFAILFSMTNALLPVCLSFPNEMIAFKTEAQNYWYSLRIFFFAKMVSELPLQILYVTLYWPIVHYLENQNPELWRMLVTCFLLLMTQLIGEAFGQIIGAVFMNNAPASIFLGPSMTLPFMLLSGGFIKIKNMSSFFTTFSYVDFVRFVLEAVLVCLYGFDRCDAQNSDFNAGKESFIVWMSAMLGLYNDDTHSDENIVMNGTDALQNGSPSERFVEELIDSMAGLFISDDNCVRSLVMNSFDLQEWFLWRAIVWLLAYLFVLRLISYYTFKAKLNS